MRIATIYIYLVFALLFTGCEKNTTTLVPLDLLSEGLALKIMAPPDVDVRTTDLGIMKDVTIQDSSGFNIQIFESEASALSAESIISDLTEDIKASAFYDSMIDVDPDGFIYKKVIDQNYVNYDFRHVKVRGDKQYVIQAGLTTTYTLEQIKLMYNAVQ